MTLSTDMYIQGEVDLAQLRWIVQEALAKFDDQQRPVDAQLWEEDSRPEHRSYSTVVGQGLPAWTFIHFGENGVWRSPEDEYAHPDDVEEGEEPWFVAPRHFAAIDFDTTYFYSGPNGETCAQLHAALMLQVGAWLEAQGVPWQWRNEYSDEIHDAYEGFEEFAGHGAESKVWAKSVMSAITATAENGGLR